MPVAANLVQTMISWLAILASCVLFFLVPEGSSTAIKWGGLAIFYVCAFRAITSPASIVPGIPTFFTIEILFLIFYYLIFLLPYQYEVLGLTNLYINKYVSYAYAEHTNQAVIATTIGVLAFTQGMRLFRPHPTPIQIRAVRPRPIVNYNGLYASLVLLHISLTLIYQVAGWRSADEGRYIGAESGGALANGTYVLIIMISIMLVAAFINNLLSRVQISPVVWIGLILALAWSIRILVYGDRNNFFLIVIALFGGLATYRIRASLLVVAIGFLGAIAVYNGVETFRMAQDKSFEMLAEAMFAGNREADLSTGSFSITLTTLKATFAIVPEAEPFAFGRYKLVGFLGVIPLIRGMLFSGSSDFLSSAELLSNYMLGPRASWSVGSNVLTDIYVDFGIIGIVILMTMLGWSAGKLQTLAAQHYRSPAMTMIYLIALPLYAEMPRYSLDFPVRMLAWAAIILLLHRFLALMFSGRPR